MRGAEFEFQIILFNERKPAQPEVIKDKQIQVQNRDVEIGSSQDKVAQCHSGIPAAVIVDRTAVIQVLILHRISSHDNESVQKLPCFQIFIQIPEKAADVSACD